MYVCKNKHHDGDRRIPETSSAFEVGSETWCSPCVRRAQTVGRPKISPPKPDLEQRGVGMNAQEQGFLV